MITTSARLTRLVLVALILCGTVHAQKLLRKLPCEVDYMGFGSALANAGDVNADGLPDLVVGSTGKQGYVRVYSGLDGSLLHHILNSDPDTSADFGWPVAGVGDVDNDGFDDFAVADPYFDIWPDERVGRVDVFSGQTGAMLYQLEGETHAGLFGFSLDALGDVDGDGHDDFLIGEPDGEVTVRAGAVRVISGQHGTYLYSVPGVESIDTLGRGVTGLGDLDGDGIEDFAAGGWDSSAGVGYVWLLSGVDGSLIREFLGNVHFTRYVDQIDSAGDVDGDGVEDLLVGDQWHDYPYHNSGAVTVLSTADGREIHRFYGSSGEEGFGTKLAGVGDIDGDGHDDVFVGAPEANSNGDHAGRAVIYSGQDGSVLWEAIGDSAWHLLGEAVTGCGDLDGDGLPEFAFCQPGETIGPDRWGAVYVYSQQCADPTVYCSTAPNSVGSGALLRSQGTLSFSANDLVLKVTQAPPDQFGLFFYGPAQQQNPFGDGYMCVAPGGIGLFRLSPAMKTDAAGEASRPIDYSAPPMSGGAGEVQAGDTWNFQFWYRDPAGPGGYAFNLTDALSATFCD